MTPDVELRSKSQKELQGLTVLVIDDDNDSRELVVEMLEQHGCSIISASSAKEGLAMLDHALPRILVCDIGMPGMDGYGFIQEVRKRLPEKGGRTVAIALTAYASAEDRRRALFAGYQAHISKPLDPTEFVAVLADVASLALNQS